MTKLLPLYDLAINDSLTIDEYIKQCTELILHCYNPITASEFELETKLPIYMRYCYNHLISLPNLKYDRNNILYVCTTLKRCIYPAHLYDKLMMLVIAPRNDVHMIFESALICVLAKCMTIKQTLRPKLDDDIINNPKDYNKFITIFGNFKTQLTITFNENPDNIMLLWKYYWTLYVAMPYLYNYMKNTGHILKLLPRLVEANNIEYSWGGKSSTAINIRTHMWEYLKNNYKDGLLH